MTWWLKFDAGCLPSFSSLVLLIRLCFDFYVIRVCCVLVWRGTPSKFGHFLILSTNHSHTSSKLSKSSQNWYSTKIFFKYPTHNWCQNIQKKSVFLSSMRKVFLPQRKVRWGSLSSGSLCNKTFTAWCINVPFFVNRPTWMNLSVWEIGTKLGSDPGIKNFGIDCDCGTSAVNFDLGSLALSWMELGQPRPIPSSKTIITIRAA